MKYEWTDPGGDKCIVADLGDTTNRLSFHVREEPNVSEVYATRPQVLELVGELMGWLQETAEPQEPRKTVNLKDVPINTFFEMNGVTWMRDTIADDEEGWLHCRVHDPGDRNHGMIHRLWDNIPVYPCEEPK